MASPRSEKAPRVWVHASCAESLARSTRWPIVRRARSSVWPLCAFFSGVSICFLPLAALGTTGDFPDEEAERDRPHQAGPRIFLDVVDRLVVQRRQPLLGVLDLRAHPFPELARGRFDLVRHFHGSLLGFFCTRHAIADCQTRTPARRPHPV